MDEESQETRILKKKIEAMSDDDLKSLFEKGTKEYVSQDFARLAHKEMRKCKQKDNWRAQL